MIDLSPVPVATTRELRTRRWIQFTFLTFAVGAALLIFNSPFAYAILIACFGSFLVGMLASVAARRRGLAHLRHHNARICPKCRYILSGLPEDGACPECGRAYLAETLRLIWNDAYQVRDTDSPPRSPKG